ncbi:MAG TPA: N-acetylmuramoyl-L-alanine amidase [Stenotrophomonas sp.]
MRPLAACLLASALGLVVADVSAGEVRALSLSAGATGTRAEIDLVGSGGYKTLSLSGPNRLVIDFPDSDGARGLKLPAPTGVVTAVRTGQPSPGTFRVVFDLASHVMAFKPQMDSGAGNAKLVIEWPGENAPAVTANPVARTETTPAPSAAAKAPPAPAIADSAQARNDAARATAALTAAVVQRANAPASVPAQSPLPASANASTAAPAPATVTSMATPVVPASGGASVASAGSGVAPAVATVTSNSMPAAVSVGNNVAGRVVPVTTAGSTPAVGTTRPAGTSASPQAILNGTAGGPAVAAGMSAVSGAATATAAAPAAAMVGPATAAVEVAEPPRPAMPSDASRIKMKAGMRPLVIAIDPGHGGQDPGAVGPTGKREKDVTLAVARELARQVNGTPGLKAFLTRENDVFIPLPMRAKKARAAGADIFISIHADAAENRSATGSSVYVLSTKGASSQRARWLADKENAADLVGGVRLQQTENTLASVLIDLAQSGHMKASEDAAGHVLGGLKAIGNNHKPQLERANFAVLRTSDMPAMLVETAFISNPDEERRLSDPGYQRKLAGAVLQGVNTFFTRQPPPGTLFAARAQAEWDAAAGTLAGGGR